jgi:hypothetical protein
MIEKACIFLDEEDKRGGQEVLDRFGICCFSMYDVLPIVPEP